LESLAAVGVLDRFRLCLGYAGGEKRVERPIQSEIEVPLLHKAVERVPPVVMHAEVEKAVFKFNALSATGTAAMLAGVLAGLCLGLKPLRVAKLYAETIWKLRVPLLTISLMLALGYVTRYSGTDTTMGLMMASTGMLFPFFSPIIGWLGVALTGSDTSSNVLFGNLAASHREPTASLAHPHGRLEQLRRCDGQDDRRAKHRRGSRGDRGPSRQPRRWHRAAQCLLAQRRAGAAHGPAGDGAGLLVAVDDHPVNFIPCGNRRLRSRL
jgi:hypothetical protein